MTAIRSQPTIAEQLAAKIETIDVGRIPAAVRAKCEDLTLDVIGLCVAARNEDYVRAALAAWDEDGICTAIGHSRHLSAAGAAFVNGTAAHGEDFDDTFEGGPVHASAVIVSAVVAASERYRLERSSALVGIAVGAETLCRLSLVAPTKIHRAGFHPTAVLGAIAAAAGVGAALRMNSSQLVNALGIAGSMASGIIEYLAEGAWTKRLHAGWAAQSGLRAAQLGRAGFVGPRTVLEGAHGFFQAFARTKDADYAALVGDFGARWVSETLAFKPYPCGTMIHPYVDCARRLAARGLKADDIRELVCAVAEGTVHRLWEPLAGKRRPPNGYAAKFSTPYCVAAGFLRGELGLDAFTDEAVQEPLVLALAAKVRYEIDPTNPYPSSFTGQMRAVLRGGQVIEERQPHLRGGVHEPLTRGEIEEKFLRNAGHGGWTAKQADAAIALVRSIGDGPLDWSPLSG